MTVTVYVWLARFGSNVGHASMQVGNGTYISLWPGDDKLGMRKRTEEENRQNERSQSLEEDIEKEGRSYDQSFAIGGLDENAMQRWWDSFNNRWWLLGQNCCKTVIDGLRVGGSERRLNFFQQLSFGMALPFTPYDVTVYCSYL